ncbi:hypothetical protein GCM10007862_28820 [Dyella lipolytica]|nr:hypothetical protein GCM10007862_28820 [Dyella lipolytica]
MDGVTDDTAAVQSAVNSGASIVEFPAGTCVCGQVTVSTGMVICGAGSGDNTSGTGTVIQPNSPTAYVFLVNTQAAVTFNDLCFRSTGTPTDGAAIALEDTTVTMGVANTFSSVFNCRFDNVYIGVRAISASSFNITNCTFWSIPAGGYGIFLDNQYSKDQGDQCISGNTFLGAVTAIGIYWVGGGGTRIVDNKFLMSKAIWAQLANSTATPTAQFMIANNSIDANQNADSALPVQLICSSGTVPFQNIIVTGNIFVGYYAMDVMIQIIGLATAIVNKVMIIGNSFTNTGGSFSGGGMVVLDYVNQFLVADNLIIGPGSSSGVNIGANCTNGSVVANEIQGFAIPVVNNGGGTVRVRGISNSGAAANISDGGTIAHGLGATPTKVWVNGSVAAQTYQPFGITSTSFQVSVRNVAGASGSAATIYWQAEV